MPGIVVDHEWSSDKARSDGVLNELFLNDFSSVNEAERIRKEQEAKAKALQTAVEQKSQEEAKARQLAKDYEQAIKDRDEARQDRTDLREAKKVLEQEKERLQVKVSELQVNNNLDKMYDGKVVAIVNIAGRQAWDVGGRAKAADPKADYIMNWTYMPSNTQQQFQLNKLHNGNWSILSLALHKYVEVSSNEGGARMYMCESSLKEDSTQEWWITFTSQGLIFESIRCPKQVVDIDSVSDGPGGNISTRSKPEYVGRDKLWTILQTTP